MANTVNLNLPLLAPGQANQTVVHNEALKMLDAIWQLSVISQEFDSPPGSPAEGDAYIVKAPGYGAWEDQGNKVAAFIEGAWQIFTPREGWQAFDKNTSTLVVFNGTTWDNYIDGLNPDKLGINTTADTTNRLSVRTTGALFTAETDDFSVTMNKIGDSDDVRFTMQSNWVTHALFGLLGSNDFSFKVTPDGSNFYTSFTLDNANGHVTFNQLMGAERTYPTIAGNALPATSSYVNPSNGGTVNNITGGFDGAILIVQPTGGSITFTNSGNIKTPGATNLVMADWNDMAIFVCNGGGTWICASVSQN